ncbi:GGDEF domain-containing protein [Maridesulfovibrio sp. FT414]|uniref:GGDEF domain-containing protein n=1 Tax=Maridesulfovibrio sp. FT414 TaxID=2979469 RepID=UPI003D800EC0
MGKLNWLGEFRDQGVEQAFQLAKWPWVRIRLLFLYFFTIAAYIIGVGTDLHDLGAGTGFNTMLVIRAAGVLLGVVAFILLLADQVRLKVQYFVMAACMFMFVVLESHELIFKYSDIGSLSVPSTVFMVLAYYVFLPPRVVPSLAAGLSGSLFYLLSLSSVIPVSSGTFINCALYFALANCFGIFFLASFGISLRREYFAHAELKKLVEYDELTGACSRRRVLEAGNSIFKAACRFNQKMAVLMMDIDNFKRVNDDYGHHVGDAVLRETSRRCRSALREVDYFGRLGGEEFVVILPHSGLHHAVSVAERLRGSVCGDEIVSGNVKLAVSVSIGVAELRRHENFAALLQEADEQLYRAKKCGRNQVSPIQLRVLECGCP